MTVWPLTPFEGMDIRSLLDSRAARRSELPFLIWEPFEGCGKTWNYAELAETIRRFAAGLHARGVAEEDRVLVHLDNCPESAIAWRALTIAS